MNACTPDAFVTWSGFTLGLIVALVLITGVVVAPCIWIGTGDGEGEE